MQLKIKGLILRPGKYSAKEIDVTFVGDRKMLPRTENENDSDRKPHCVGLITLRGECREFLGALPFDSLSIIASLLETKRIRFVDLSGLALTHGHADIQSFSFCRNYGPIKD